jgi:hypothetical protein
METLQENIPINPEEGIQVAHEPLLKKVVMKTLNIVVLIVLVTITAGIILTLGLSSYHPG